MSTLALKRKRDMRRQRGQFIAVAVTIGLGVMLFASTYDAYRNLDGSYNATYDRLAFADISAIGVDPSFVDTALAIPGVDQAEARLQADIPMRVGSHTFLGTAIAYPPSGQPSVNKIDVVEGEYLDPDDPTGIVVESHMADQFDVSVGDRIEILVGAQFVEARVLGVAVSAEYIWPARNSQDIFPPPMTFGVVFVSEDVTTDLPEGAARNDVVITYTADAELEATDRAVESAAEAADASDVIPRADQASNSTLLLDVNGFASMSVLFPTLFMTAAGMAAFVLLTRIVFAQRGVIGTLRASGMTKRMILRHFLSYGFRLGLVAGIVGLVVGMVSAYAITGVYTAQLDIPDTVRSFHWVTPVIGMVFALGAGMLGAWAPARRAFKVSPAEAMRGSTPEASARVSLFERLVPPLRRLPTRWLMILRGLGRNKRRSFATMLGVVLGLVLIMVSWGMIDSIVVMMDRQFEEVSLQDADVVMATPVTADSVVEIIGVEGVQIAEVVAQTGATATFGGSSFTTFVWGYRPGTVMHGFPDGLPTDGVLAGKGLADELGVSVGDQIGLSLTTLDVDVDVELKGFLDEPVGVALYMDYERFTDIVGVDVVQQPSVSQIQATFDSGVVRTQVIADLRDVEGVAFVGDSRALYDLLQEYLGFFYVFVGLMLILGGAMAFALMYNAISVNVAERSGEFATMRANGLSHSSVASLIAFENILLTVLGVIPGVIAGYAVGFFFMSQFSVDAFSIDFSMRTSSIALSVVAMLGAAVLSLIPAIRKVKRIDIGETVRERAV